MILYFTEHDEHLLHDLAEEVTGVVEDHIVKANDVTEDNALALSKLYPYNTLVCNKKYYKNGIKLPNY